MNLKILLFSLILFSTQFNAQTYLFGKVISENNTILPGTSVLNVTTDQKTITDENGDFMIKASAGDQIRFARNYYDRLSLRLTEDQFISSIKVTMLYNALEIEEVQIAFVPTGDLKNDMKKLPKNTKVSKLREDIAMSFRQRPTDVIEPRLTTPSAFAPPDLNMGQGDIGALVGIISSLIGKATGPKITKPNYSETQEFIKKVKSAINKDYYFQYGMNDEQLDVFLADADKKLKLAKNYRKNFKIKDIERMLKEFFVNYRY